MRRITLVRFGKFWSICIDGSRKPLINIGVPHLERSGAHLFLLRRDWHQSQMHGVLERLFIFKLLFGLQLQIETDRLFGTQLQPKRV
jgi:hypothetical protein